MFEEGKLYVRRDLHRQFGGQQQGGISTPANHPLIFLFTGEPGKRFGYFDSSAEDGTFEYYGEAQRGDMEFRRGNKAIRDHVVNGKQLHLFTIEPHQRRVRYLGRMICVDHDLARAEDVNGRMRQAIVFRLKRVVPG